jgi:hypothetical protein
MAGEENRCLNPHPANAPEKEERRLNGGSGQSWDPMSIGIIDKLPVEVVNVAAIPVEVINSLLPVDLKNVDAKEV